jgi:hydantoinase/carbamoylase family amidase
MARCDALATCTEETGRITRPYGTPALLAAREKVATWLRAAGMTVHVDAVGNLRGRLDGANPQAPALLLGSHLDSVRDAGRYDGPLGVLVALAAVERWHAEGRQLPFPVEVVAFADEEGLRFQTAYLGSRALAGTFDAALLARTDADGVGLREAIAAFGGDPDRLGDAALRPGAAFAYIEVHIEQGPHLEAIDQAVGVVSAIVGGTRIAVTIAGEAGHAGTVAMNLRHDALPAAAECILAAERAARATPGLVATVGQFAVEPGASNVIPGQVRFSLDVRHADDAVRAAAVATLESQTRAIAAARSLDIDWQVVQDNPAVQCDAALVSELGRAAAGALTPDAPEGHVPHLVSGAGHDAVVMSSIVPVAMLFVRCAGGVSHNPAESVTAADVAVAIDVLDGFLAGVAERQP